MVPAGRHRSRLDVHGLGLVDARARREEAKAQLRQGTLAVVSGKIVKQSPGAMRVRTPASVMGVRFCSMVRP